MKRVLSCVLCVILTCMLWTTAALGEYPTKWNIQDVYEDDAAFDDDCAAVRELIAQIGAYRGRLGDTEALRGFMELKGAIERILMRMNAYETLLSGLNASDAHAAAISGARGALVGEYAKALSFEDGEWSAMTPEARTRLAQSPEVGEYRYALRKLEDPDTVWLDENESTMLAVFAQALGSNASTFNILQYVELPDSEYYTPDGERVILDNEGYMDLLHSDLSTEELITIERQSAKRYRPLENTFASLLDGHMRGSWALAQACGFDSVRAYSMDDTDVEPAIYDLIIEAGHRSTSALSRYKEIYLRHLGLEGEPYSFEVYRALEERNAAGGAFSAHKPFDESVADVRNALSIFGDEYISIFDRIVREGHVDAYPASGKDTGAFCMAVGADTLPYVLLNYDKADSGDGAAALAHEMGHALYDYFSTASQPFQYQEPSLFTHEVTSTANELIFFDYMYNKAQTDAERMYYLRQELTMFYTTYFYQMLLAEMEDYCYQIVEHGGTLTSENLNAKFGELQSVYGSVARSVDGYESEWADSPHLYYNYYVYQYVTSLTYSSAIASRILAGDTATLDSYLRFLKLGGSASPSELLKTVGIDTLDPETYDAPIAYYSGLLDKYEALLGHMGL